MIISNQLRGDFWRFIKFSQIQQVNEVVNLIEIDSNDRSRRVMIHFLFLKFIAALTNKFKGLLILYIRIPMNMIP